MSTTRFFDPGIDSFFLRSKPKRLVEPKFYGIDEPGSIDVRDLFEHLNSIDPADPYATIGPLTPTNPTASGRHQRELTLSPQIRKIAPGTSQYIPIYLVPRNTSFTITGYSWYCQTCQGEQDLIVRLFVGSDKISQSGKVAAPTAVPPFSDLQTVSEARAAAAIGLPPNSISSASGSGLPDNFALSLHGARATAQAGETIYFVVQNQSAVYNHGIEVFLRGYSSQNEETEQ